MASAAAIPSVALPVVHVYESGNAVVVKWDDGDETRATLDTVYTGPGFSFSVERANGNEPRVKTFGSLLYCGGGVLAIGKTRYRIKVSSPSARQENEQQSETSALSQLMERLGLQASRRATCRFWTGNDRKLYQLGAPSFLILNRNLRRRYAFDEDVEFCLYFIPDERDVNSRQYVSDDQQLDDYFEHGGNPTLYVWLKEDPYLSPASLPSDTVTKVSSSDPSPGSSSTRGHVQKKFRNAVRHRDDFKCVVSGTALRDKTGNVQAAHILGVESSLKHFREEAGVLNEYDTTNGMLLEQSLHVAFDAYRWCMDETGTIRVNTAVRENEDLAKWDGRKIELRIGEANYPPEELLKVRYKLYCEKINV